MSDRPPAHRRRAPNDGAERIIEMRGVRKRVGAVWVLDGVDLDVDRGTTVAIVGPRGPGPGMLLRLLAASDRPDLGAITVAGHHLEQHRSLTEYRRTVVGVMDGRATAGSSGLTAQQLVEAAMLGTARRFPERMRRAAGLLELVGLGAERDEWPNQLSVGQQQRVGLAAALANEPALIVADEPTVGLEDADAKAIAALLRRLAEDGTTVVLASRDARLIDTMDRLVMFEQGRITRS